MTKRAFAISCMMAVVLLTGTALAQKPAFEFQGIRVGMSVEELKGMFPNAICEERDNGFAACSHIKDDESYNFSFSNGKLTRVNAWFGKDRYQQVREQFVAKYGKANKPDYATKNAEVLVWMRKGDSMMVLEQVAQTAPDKSTLLIADDSGTTVAKSK